MAGTPDDDRQYPLARRMSEPRLRPSRPRARPTPAAPPRPAPAPKEDGHADVGAMAGVLGEDPRTSYMRLAWQSRCDEEVAAHIVTHYHRPIEAELLDARDVAERLPQRADAARRAAREDVLRALDALGAHVLLQLTRVENVVIPALIRPAVRLPEPCVRSLRDDHRDAGRHMVALHAAVETCTPWLVNDPDQPVLTGDLLDLEERLLHYARFSLQVTYPRVLRIGRLVGAH